MRPSARPRLHGQGLGIGGHQRAVAGATDDWLTPPELVANLGIFDLDPCGCPGQPWPLATRTLTPPADGLAEPWLGRVWLNPPYGPQTARWLERLADHGDGIALIFARTETAGFDRAVWQRADALYFLVGRLYFHTPDGRRALANAGAPSVLVAYGARNVAALRACTWPGYLCNWERR